MTHVKKRKVTQCVYELTATHAHGRHVSYHVRVTGDEITVYDQRTGTLRRHIGSITRYARMIDVAIGMEGYHCWPGTITCWASFSVVPYPTESAVMTTDKNGNGCWGWVAWVIVVMAIAMVLMVMGLGGCEATYFGF